MSATLEIATRAANTLVRGTVLTDGVRLTTHCMYPSNSLVHVVVRGGGDSYYVSDQGGAVSEVAEAGGDPGAVHKKFKQLVDRQGIHLRDGVLYSPTVSVQDLPAAIAMIANASKEIADRLFDQLKVKRDRNFKVLLRQMLKATFSDKAVRELPVVGKSNKAHRFENVIQLSSGKRIIFDPVVRDSASISARVIANLDIHAAHHENLEQRLVYDDDEDWQSEDLNLLLMCESPVIRFSDAANEMRRLASA